MEFWVHRRNAYLLLKCFHLSSKMNNFKKVFLEIILENEVLDIMSFPLSFCWWNWNIVIIFSTLLF